MASEPDIDRLYTLPLSEFTAARNELAKALRAAGDRAAADRVKGLAKPSLAAWAVNQLYHRERQTFDRLLSAGVEQHRAVTRRGAISRAVVERKRAALQELLRRAERLLEKGGTRWTPALRQRLTRTLEALAAQAPASETVLGRLTADLQPAGFDALLGASLPPTGATGSRGRRKPKPRSRRPSATAVRRLEAARARVTAVRSELAADRRKKTAAAKTLARLERQAAAARKRSVAADRRAEEARRRADELELEARRAGATLEDAARAVARTEARLETEARKADDLAGS